MAKEIERRFLLSGLPYFNGPVVAKHIEQLYFPLANTEHESLRIRMTGGQNYEITGKEGSGISRDERNFDINGVVGLGEFLMSKLSLGIIKLRLVHEGWEIDILDHPLSGIILAEKELKSEDEELNIPDWLRPFIIKEVTNSLNNYKLALLASELRGLDVSAFIYVDRQSKPMGRMVITGGPGSGKSTIMEMLKSRPNLHLVPEVATILLGQVGLSPVGSVADLARFQRVVFNVQRTFEDASIAEAKVRDKYLTVFDRGLDDALAYMPNGRDDFQNFLGCNPESQYPRYDIVACLAVPPRDVYERIKGNNPNRMESWEEAMELDRKTRDAWSSHPNFHYIDNSQGWGGKVNGVMALINNYCSKFQR